MFYYKAYQSIFDVYVLSFQAHVLCQSCMVWKWCFRGLKLAGNTAQTFQTNLYRHATITYLWQQLKQVWCVLWLIIKQVWRHDLFITPHMIITSHHECTETVQKILNVDRWTDELCGLADNNSSEHWLNGGAIYCCSPGSAKLDWNQGSLVYLYSVLVLFGIKGHS